MRGINKTAGIPQTRQILLLSTLRRIYSFGYTSIYGSVFPLETYGLRIYQYTITALSPVNLLWKT